MGKQTQTTGLKKKKKSWVMILSPKEFKSVELGKTMSFDPDNIMGRTIKINYSTISGDPKKQNVELGFKIIKSKENVADTELVEYKIWSAYIKRLVKKAKTKLEDSFKIVTNDKFSVVVKPFIVTKSIVNKNVQTLIRMKVRESFKIIAEKRGFNQIVQDLINYSIQRELRNELKKITPLASLEIRWFKRLKV